MEENQKLFQEALRMIVVAALLAAVHTQPWSPHSPDYPPVQAPFNRATFRPVPIPWNTPTGFDQKTLADPRRLVGPRRPATGQDISPVDGPRRQLYRPRVWQHPPVPSPRTRAAAVASPVAPHSPNPARSRLAATRVRRPRQSLERAAIRRRTQYLQHCSRGHRPSFGHRRRPLLSRRLSDLGARLQC